MSSAEASSCRSPSACQASTPRSSRARPAAALPERAVSAPAALRARAAPTTRQPPRDRSREPIAPFGEAAVREPEPAQRARERERAVRVARGQPVECDAEVVVVELQPFRTTPPRRRSGARTPLGKLREERCVATRDLVRVPRRRRAARPRIADRLEHQEAVVADRLHEARVDEGSETVEIRAGDLLRGCERERPAKTARRAKSAWTAGPRRS